ncbi:MAG TPA: hypothetical protein VFY67_07810 [Pyrinomonadaceae bacterium]|nr:hypothetical protein [Pyrinomonadaceae bacterium]
MRVSISNPHLLKSASLVIISGMRRNQVETLAWTGVNTVVTD